jgi:hypothetical protein
MATKDYDARPMVDPEGALETALMPVPSWKADALVDVPSADRMSIGSAASRWRKTTARSSARLRKSR